MKPPATTRLASTAVAVVLGAALAAPAAADGIVVDRVYDPYVQPLETEIEWRSVIQRDEETPDLQRHSLGIGRSLSDRWAVELYAVGTRTEGESLDLDLYELEIKRQITEQGEYAVDWGAVFELERVVDADIWEASAAVIAARDIGRWTALANLAVIYEWGSGVTDEIETELHAQARYRLRETFEPAVELHVGQDTAALGPALTGIVRTSPGRKLRWEAGLFWGLDDETADRIVKLNLEYEF